MTWRANFDWSKKPWSHYAATWAQFDSRKRSLQQSSNILFFNLHLANEILFEFEYFLINTFLIFLA